MRMAPVVFFVFAKYAFAVQWMNYAAFESDATNALANVENSVWTDPLLKIRPL